MSALAPVHSVHFYNTHKALIDRLCGIVSSGLSVGNAVLIVATQYHRDQLVDALELNGVDVETHIREKRFALYDAKEMLFKFMVGSMPDTGLFLTQWVSYWLMQRGRHGAKIRVSSCLGKWWPYFGTKGIKPEQWNDILNERAFHLHALILDHYSLRMKLEW